MTRDRTTEQRLTDWLREAQFELPDRVLEETFHRASGTQQDRAVPGWRTFLMDRKVIRFAAGAAAIAVVVLAGAAYFGQPGDSNVGAILSPTPMPTATPSPDVSVAPGPTTQLDTAEWVSYESVQYSFTIGHPGDWTVKGAARQWAEADAAEGPLTAGVDTFLNRDETVAVSAWEIPPASGSPDDGSSMDLEAWVVDYCQRTNNTDCAEIPERAVPLCLEWRDCHPGLLVPFEADVQAFFTGGAAIDPVTVVAVWRAEGDPTTAGYGGSRRLLEAFLSTVNGGGNAGVFPASSTSP